MYFTQVLHVPPPAGETLIYSHHPGSTAVKPFSSGFMVRDVSMSAPLLPVSSPTLPTTNTLEPSLLPQWIRFKVLLLAIKALHSHTPSHRTSRLCSTNQKPGQLFHTSAFWLVYTDVTLSNCPQSNEMIQCFRRKNMMPSQHHEG